MKTIESRGQEYHVVMDSPDVMVAYRYNAATNHIRIVTKFQYADGTIDERADLVHVDTWEKIMAHREYMKEVEKWEEGQQVLNHELEQVIEGRVAI